MKFKIYFSFNNLHPYKNYELKEIAKIFGYETKLLETINNYFLIAKDNIPDLKSFLFIYKNVSEKNYGEEFNFMEDLPIKLLLKEDKLSIEIYTETGLTNSLAYSFNYFKKCVFEGKIDEGEVSDYKLFFNNDLVKITDNEDKNIIDLKLLSLKEQILKFEFEIMELINELKKV